MNSSTKFLPKQKLPCPAHFREYKSPFRCGPTYTEDFRNHSTFAEDQRSERWTTTRRISEMASQRNISLQR